MAYTATDVKNLRERTGAGMMDCKKALDETGGDFEAAVDVLRAKGLAAVAKKSSRTAAEGLVGVAVGKGAGALVEVNAETDFVARNEEFKSFVKSAADLALAEGGNMEKLLVWLYCYLLNIFTIGIKFNVRYYFASFIIITMGKFITSNYCFYAKIH